MKFTLLGWAFLISTLAHGQAQPDFNATQIKTAKISDNFYTLEGQGGAIGVLTGPDGVFMVDSQFAPLSAKIGAAIRQITDKPIRLMVNTHVHPDHTGGNENFAKAGVVIFSREALRYRLAHPSPAPNGTPGVPAPSAALPIVTYDSPVTIHMDGEEIHLIPLPNGHTDGDTLVQFVSNNVVMTGDVFRSVGYPNIDRANGGTLKGILEALSITIAHCDPKTKVIPGHGPPVDRSAVLAQRDLIIAVRDKVAGLVQQGKTVGEVIAAKPTSEFDAVTQNAAGSSARFIRGLYAELTNK